MKNLSKINRALAAKKKFFTFFAAMLLALTVNATTTWNITNAKNDTLLKVILEATGGDTIVMAAGTYAEGVSAGDFCIDKSLVIKAAADANVTIQPQLPMKVRKGSRVEFIGVKFDVSNLRKRASWPSNVILSYDASDGNKLIFEGCEFNNDTINAPIIYCASSNKLDSCIVNNCKIRGIKKSFIFLENSALLGLIVTNSTFSNITTEASYGAGIIDPRGSSAKVRVDQCTFYNCNTNASDRGIIRVANSTDAVVSNSIFMMPSSDATRAICIKGGEVKNCLLKNFSKGTHGIHTDSPWNPTITGCSALYEQDPIFANATDGDFTLDEEDSPAKGTGVGGTHLGDPRWWPSSWKPAAVIHVSSVALDHEVLTLDVNETAFLHATVLPAEATYPDVTWSTSDDTKVTVVNGTVKGIAAGTATITATADGQTATCDITVSDAIPSTNFATPYFLKGTKATLTGNIFVNEADSLYYDDHEECGTATWKINALTGGVLEATANYKKGSASGAKLQVVILDANENQVGDTLKHDWYGSDGDKALSGSVLLPKAGVYTIKLLNALEYSSAKLKGITLTKTGNVPTIQMFGQWDSWVAPHNFTLADNGLTASTTISLDENHQHEFKMKIDGEWRANKHWFKRNATTAANITADGDNMKFVADIDGTYTVTWLLKTNTLVVTFPDLPFAVPDGWYLAGTFDGVNEWQIYNLTPSKKFVVNPDNNEEFYITRKLVENDHFKAVYVEDEVINAYKPAEGDDYLVTAGLAGDTKTIYFRETWYEDWGGHFFVSDDSPATSLNETSASDQAVKRLENGQLVIIRGENAYTVTGVRIR